jgi:hypothetical protein
VVLLPAGTILAGEHRRVRTELLKRFGGVTSYTRAPAKGLWKTSRRAVRAVADDVIVHEVLVTRLDLGWWRQYRRQLEDRFDQSLILIHAARITQL